MAIASATVKGGFWEVNGVATLVSMSGKGDERRLVDQALDTKGMYPMREIMFALTGAAAGGTATKNYTAVAPSTELGGARAIETQVLVNRATTAGDVTEIKNDFLRFSTRTTFGANPPPNLDRNPLGTR